MQCNAEVFSEGVYLIKTTKYDYSNDKTDVSETVRDFLWNSFIYSNLVSFCLVMNSFSIFFLFVFETKAHFIAFTAAAVDVDAFVI